MRVRDDTLRRCAVDSNLAGGRLDSVPFLGCVLYIFAFISRTVLAAPVERPTTDVRAVDILKYIYPG